MQMIVVVTNLSILFIDFLSTIEVAAAILKEDSTYQHIEEDFCECHRCACFIDHDMLLVCH